MQITRIVDAQRWGYLFCLILYLSGLILFFSKLIVLWLHGQNIWGFLFLYLLCWLYVQLTTYLLFQFLQLLKYLLSPIQQFSVLVLTAYLRWIYIFMAAILSSAIITLLLMIREFLGKLGFILVLDLIL